MKKHISTIVFLIFVSIFFSCDKKEKIKTNIIPLPQEMNVFEGKFIINKTTKFLYDNNEDLKQLALFFNEKLEKAAGFKLITAQSSEDDNNCIILQLGNCPAMLGNEGYTFFVTDDNIKISANKPAGIFYGLQTLQQLLPSEIESSRLVNGIEWGVPLVSITDKPRFVWRGMLLDCCRHFMDKEFIKRYIDLLAYHKMNRFHWHLTEDQGWRIEIKQFPELTKKSAWRTEKDGTVYGGFYTQDDIKEIVAYAKSRFIEVVPEIEMPGHSLAALAAYPELSCTGGPFEVGNEWGVFKDIYCAGNEKSFEFLEKVLDEVFQLFPFEYIHIGGDEAPKYRWKNCKKCQKRIADNGLKDEHELQSYFISRMEKYINDHGKRIIGWDEILEGGLAPSATVQSWRGFKGAMAAAKQGHDAIVSPTSHAYFDYSVETTDLKKVYYFEPVPSGLKPELEIHILGGECNMWTERAPQEEIDNRMFPRILAMSEVLWTFKDKSNFFDFHERVQNHYNNLDFLGVKYGFEGKTVTLISDFDSLLKSFNVKLIPGQNDFDIYYTLDGTEPTNKSESYIKPLKITESLELKILAQKQNSDLKKYINQKYSIHKATGITVKLKYPFSPNYTGNNDNALTDGLRGTTNFRDGKWQGFNGVDLVADIDMGKIESYSRIKAGFLQSMLSWIFIPKEIIIYASYDGKDFHKLGSLITNTDPHLEDKFIETFTVEFDKTSSRYIRLIAKSLGPNPEWHEAAGANSWLFADEIIVE